MTSTAAIALSSMAPLVLNTTTLAMQDLSGAMGTNYQQFQHSGNEFPSVGELFGAVPLFTCKSPFLSAYNLIGLKGLPLTALQVYHATFAAGIRQSTQSTNYMHNLVEGATAWAQIDGANVAENGVLMANISVHPLYGAPLTYPLELTDDVALPTLGSEPALHTLGPISLGGTRINGMTNSGFSQNIQLRKPINDGDQGPRTAIYMGADPRLEIGHEDPITLLGDLGYLGAAAAAQAVILYFRAIDATTQLLDTTGISMTIANGRTVPARISFGLGQTAKMGLSIRTLSASGTHPIAIATGATLPT